MRSAASRFAGGSRCTSGSSQPSPEVGLVGVEDHQPAVEEDSEALRGLLVVLVNLGNALGEVVDQVIDRVVERHLDQLLAGKQPGQLAPERGVHAVVVVGMEESALPEIAAERDQIVLAPADVPVPGHVEVGKVPQVVVPQRDDPLLGSDPQTGSGSDGLEKIGQAGGIGVPVAAPVVVQPADRHERAGGRRRGRPLRGGRTGDDQTRQEQRRRHAASRAIPSPVGRRRCAASPESR